MRIGAQPAPNATMAILIVNADWAKANNRPPPPAPRANMKADVVFAPTRSNNTPTTNWQSAKVTNQAPSESESSAGDMPTSDDKAGDKTAKNER